MMTFKAKKKVSKVMAPEEDYGNFIGNIAHIFNNRLTSIIGNLECLTKAKCDPINQGCCYNKNWHRLTVIEEMSRSLQQFVKKDLEALAIVYHIKDDFEVLDKMKDILEVVENEDMLRDLHKMAIDVQMNNYVKAKTRKDKAA